MCKATGLFWIVLLVLAKPSWAQFDQLASIERWNRALHGRVDNYTRNHGVNRRLPSRLLGSGRDLYVYTPPGYDPRRQYPLVLWLHGAYSDEHIFFHSAQLTYLDRMIQTKQFPPMVVVAPDGTIKGRNFVLSDHSFFMNGVQGAFRDHVMREVLPFVERCYSIDPCRCAHAVIGVSAGGGGAMTLALRRCDYFGYVAVLSGALNLRYYNCFQDYHRDFDAKTFRWRTTLNTREVVARLGGLPVRAGRFIEPVFGNDRQTFARVRSENAADVLVREGPKPINSFVAFGRQDQFNFDAHAESFVWLARQRGMDIDVRIDPDGKHNADFFEPMQRESYRWLARHWCAEPSSTCCLE